MNILLVDDEQSFLEVMKALLNAAGHSVVLAGDGKAAREVLDLEKIDLIISDIMMPTLDGARFHSYVREFTANSDVPFIFMSGLTDVAQMLDMDPARDFFLSKNSNAEEILKLVDQVSRQDSDASA
jgi:DNA-binding response OmpR family regulator